MPAAERSRYAVGAGSITSSKSVIDLKVGTAVLEPLATAVPDQCELHKIEFEGSAIAASATQLIWNLAKDALGNYAISPEVTTTLVTGAGTATLFGCAETILCDRVLSALAVAGHVYLVGRSNTGTFTIDKALLFWRF